MRLWQPLLQAAQRLGVHRIRCLLKRKRVCNRIRPWLTPFEHAEWSGRRELDAPFVSRSVGSRLCAGLATKNTSCPRKHWPGRSGTRSGNKQPTSCAGQSGPCQVAQPIRRTKSRIPDAITPSSGYTLCAYVLAGSTKRSCIDLTCSLNWRSTRLPGLNSDHRHYARDVLNGGLAPMRLHQGSLEQF